jgi:hypothetical protein
MSAYDDVLSDRRESMSGAYARTQAGDPRKAARALVQVLSSDKPPRRLLLGQMAADLGPQVYSRRLDEWAQWDAIARDTDFDS